MASSPSIPTRPSWTSTQAQALHAIRTELAAWVPATGDAPTPEARAAVPTARVPADIHLTSALAPPAQEMPPALHDAHVAPARVPVFFYALNSTSAPAAPPPATNLLFFVHGGGNTEGHPADAETLPWLADLARALPRGALIVTPSYRLATVRAHAFPAQLQDLYTAYAYLLAQGFDLAHISVVGESAGGNLALTFTHLLCSESAGLRAPARLVAIAPSADATYTLSAYARAQADADLFALSSYKQATANWLNTPAASFPRPSPPSSPSPPSPTACPPPSHSWPATHPLVSASFIPSYPPALWPRTLLFCGGADQLIDGVRAVARRMSECAVDVTYVELADMPHCYWMFPIFAECEQTKQRLADFVV